MPRPLPRYRFARGWFRSWIVGLLGLVIMLVAPSAASAHPLGNFTINHYSRLEVAPQRVRIFYVLDMAEIPTFQTMPEIDRDGDGQVSTAEGADFAAQQMETLQRGLTLTSDGKPVALEAEGAPDLSFPPGQGGLSLLRLTFWLTALLPESGTNAPGVEYQDTNGTDRLGWREIVVRGTDGVTISDSTVSDQD